MLILLSAIYNRFALPTQVEGGTKTNGGSVQVKFAGGNESLDRQPSLYITIFNSCLISLLSLESRSIKNLNLFANWQKVTDEWSRDTIPLPAATYTCINTFGAKRHLCAGVTSRVHEIRFRGFFSVRIRWFSSHILAPFLTIDIFECSKYTFSTYRNNLPNFGLRWH